MMILVSCNGEGVERAKHSMGLGRSHRAKIVDWRER